MKDTELLELAWELICGASNKTIDEGGPIDAMPHWQEEAKRFRSEYFKYMELKAEPQRYAAVIKLSNGEAALATHDQKIITGIRRDIYKLFGDLIVQLVPISSLTTVEQIDVRKHCPDMFKNEALFQGGSLHGTYEELKGKPDEIIRDNEVYRFSPLAKRVVYRYVGDVE